MPDNIFLFVPNLIGYARILLLFLALPFMKTHCVTTLVLYFLSAILDAFDGFAARALNQSTKFGAMLDMLTDRCGTMCLVIALINFFPEWTVFFTLSIAIDIFSHWAHLHVSSVVGGQSHKIVSAQENRILHVYYTNKQFLFFMCCGNELFYMTLYLVHFHKGPLLFGYGVFQILVLFSLPIALAKLGISLLQMCRAFKKMAEVDVRERSLVAQ